MIYKPNPIDTTGVVFSKQIQEMTDKLAENVHEIWAKQRIADGWTYGPERNDAKKEHPNLVPYQHLSESEKQYDKNIIVETIKAIISKDYHIELFGKATEGVSYIDNGNRKPKALFSLYKDLESMDLKTSLEIWSNRILENWSKTPKVCQSFANQFLRLGEPLLAYDAASEGIKSWPEDIKLQQLMAMALLRSRSTKRAIISLKKLYKEGARDEETLGMLGRAHKDLAEKISNEGERNYHLNKAYEYYSEAFEGTEGFWTGINSATLVKILGKNKKSKEFARKVRKKSLTELDREAKLGGDLYWLTATLAETALIDEQWDDAENWYKNAAKLAGRRLGDLISTRRNARLLMSKIDMKQNVRNRIEQCFNIPNVIVFTGNTIDQPNRKEPKFPPEIENDVRIAIHERLIELDGKIGFSSAACGSDILFLESVLDLKGEIYIVLPYEREKLKKDCVDIIPYSDWDSRFDRVIEDATEVLIASEEPIEIGSVPNYYANLLLQGLAKIRAEQLETNLIPLAVWDGKAGDRPWGTANIVSYWQKIGLQIDYIDLNRILFKDHRILKNEKSFEYQNSKSIESSLIEMEL